MRRVWAILIALGLPLVLLAGFALGQHRPGLPVAARARVAAYLDFVSRTEGVALAFVDARHARQPWQFTILDSAATFGDSVFFDTSHPLRWPLPDRGPPPGAGLTAATGAPGLRPLPYPVADAWCVRLVTAGRSRGRTVVVALHQDLYNADWILHVLVDPPEPAGATTRRIGCPSQ
jgi:hypothetical protein